MRVAPSSNIDDVHFTADMNYHICLQVPNTWFHWVSSAKFQKDHHGCIRALNSFECNTPTVGNARRSIIATKRLMYIQPLEQRTLDSVGLLAPIQLVWSGIWVDWGWVAKRLPVSSLWSLYHHPFLLNVADVPCPASPWNEAPMKGRIFAVGHLDSWFIQVPKPTHKYCTRYIYYSLCNSIVVLNCIIWKLPKPEIRQCCCSSCQLIAVNLLRLIPGMLQFYFSAVDVPPLSWQGSM